MDANGVSLGTMGYKPFGETRFGSTPTDRRFIPLQGTGRPARREQPRLAVRLWREVLLALS